MEVYLSQVHDGSVSSGFRALYEERLLLDVTLLIEEHHFQVRNYSTCHTTVNLKDNSSFGLSPPLTPFLVQEWSQLENPDECWCAVSCVNTSALVCSSHFQAHKALLATQSDYFRVMFTADMRERDQDKIHMKGLTAAGFGHILRFMYYGSLELSMPTVQEILQVTRTQFNGAPCEPQN